MNIGNRLTAIEFSFSTMGKPEDRPFRNYTDKELIKYLRDIVEAENKKNHLSSVGDIEKYWRSRQSKGDCSYADMRTFISMGVDYFNGDYKI